MVHSAEDFKQGAKFGNATDLHTVEGTLLKIPLCYAA
jgi:hypothetical protein